jgi:hypothetical protein
MGLRRKKEEFDKRKPIKFKKIEETKPTLWCRKHGCTKVACGCKS